MNRFKPTTRFRLAGSFAGALALLFLASCELGAPTKGGGTEGEGVVGSLVDPSGAPLAGVWVKAFPVQAALAKSGLSTATAAESVLTDVNGFYHFPGLSAGVYNFTATTTASGTTYALFLQSVVITSGLNTIHGDTLRVSGTLTFQVQAGGQGVEGALCYLDGSPWSAVSDANGTCTLAGLPPGTLQFNVSHPAFASVLTQAASVVSGTVSNGGTVIANNSATVSRMVKVSWPDSVAPIVGQEKLATRVARVVFRRNSVVVKDTVLLTFFPSPGALAAVYDNLQVFGGDTLKISVYGRLKGQIEHTYPGPDPADSSTILFTGKHVVLLTDLPQDTLNVPLVYAGPTGLPDAPTLQPHLTTVVPLSDTLRWSAANLAQTYHVQLATDSMFIGLVLNDSTVTTTARAYGPLNPGYYFWRVRAKNATGTGPWARWQSFVTVGTGGNDSTPPGKPAIPATLAPAPSATGVSVYATLTWARSGNGAADTAAGSTQRYRILLAIDTSFTMPLLDDNLTFETGATSYARMTPRLLAGTRYYWRVVAIGPGGYSASNLASFTTESPAGPFMPVGLSPLSPAHNAANVPTSAQLSWSPGLPGAVFDLTVSRDSLFTTIALRDSNLLVAGRHLDSLLPGTRYFWKVTTRIPQGMGIMGEFPFFAFNTAGQAPAVPLTIPDTMQTDSGLIVSWTPAPRPDTTFVPPDTGWGDTIVPAPWTPPAPPDSTQDTTITPPWSPVLPPLIPDTTFTDTGVIIRWIPAPGPDTTFVPPDTGWGDTTVTTPWNPPAPPDTSWMDTIVPTPWNPPAPPDTSWMDTIVPTPWNPPASPDTGWGDTTVPAPWNPPPPDSTSGDTTVTTPWEPPPPPDSVWSDTLSQTVLPVNVTKAFVTVNGAETFERLQTRSALLDRKTRGAAPQHRSGRVRPDGGIRV